MVRGDTRTFEGERAPAGEGDEPGWSRSFERIP